MTIQQNYTVLEKTAVVVKNVKVANTSCNFDKTNSCCWLVTISTYDFIKGARNIYFINADEGSKSRHWKTADKCDDVGFIGWCLEMFCMQNIYMW